MYRTFTKAHRTTMGLILAWMTILLIGCGGSSEQQAADDLLKRQAARENKTSNNQSLTQRLSDAQSLFDQRNFAAAQFELRSLLAIEPAHAQALLLYARCERETKDASAAIEILEQIPTTDRQAAADASQLAAEWLIEQSNYPAAQDWLERAISMPDSDQLPQIHSLYHTIVSVLNNQGLRNDAAQYLRLLARAEVATEKELFAMNTIGDPFIDVSMPKPPIGSESSVAASPAELAEAKRLRGEGELERAKALGDALAKSFPLSTPIAAFRLRVYSDLKLDQSIADLIKSVPPGIENEPEYWHALGAWLQRQNRDREAVRCFVEAVMRDETDRFSYLLLARSLKLIGNDASAEQANQRFALLQQTAVITAKIGRERGTAEQYARLSAILDQLNRPWEAIGWRQVATKSLGEKPTLAEQVPRPNVAMGADELALRQQFVTCGIDPLQWPAPALDATALISDADSGSGSRHSSDPVVRSSERFQLVNVADQTGLSIQYDGGDDPSDAEQLLHQLTGGGIAVIDMDLDGHPDLYFTQGGGPAFDAAGSKPNQLLRNIDGARWVPLGAASGTADLGYGQGVAAADLNQDGFVDLVIANIGPNVIFQNNGDGTFQRRPWPGEAAPGKWTTSIALGDLSRDGLPEIVEVNYVDDPSALTIACTPQTDECNPSVFRPALDRVYQIQPDGSIVNWDGCESMGEQPNYGFAAIIANFDERNGNDLFIANDTEHNHYWLSQDTSDSVSTVLRESAQILGCAFGVLGQRQGCMGIAAGDFDHNGMIDLHVTNFWNQAADLYMLQPSGAFTNENTKRGLYQSTRLTVGWGTQAVDFDHDGWLDLAVLNGNLTDHRGRGRDYQMKPQFFAGTATGFDELKLPSPYWSAATLGRTMAIIDFNQDHKLDLVTNHLDAPVALIENQTVTGNFIQFELIGTASERDAIGAVVTVTAGGQRWRNWQTGGDGFLCSNEPVLDIGIGDHDVIEEVEVVWPSGISQQFSQTKTGQRYLIVEGDDSLFPRE